MSQRAEDAGTETFNPLLERLLDRHQAEVLDRLERYHRVELAAIRELRIESTHLDTLLQRIVAATAKLPQI